MKMVVTSFNKKFRSQKRLDSRAFTDVIIDRGNTITRYIKQIYDLTHSTWHSHPYFAPAFVEKGRSGYAGVMEFGVILNDAKSELEYDRSPYSEPVSSGQIWRWLDNGTETKWSFAESGFVPKTKPGSIVAGAGVGGMKYRGMGEMKYHKLAPGTIEPRNWSEELNKIADGMYKKGMRDATKDAVNAFRRELRNV